jgi:hypothetical protein
MISFQRSFSSCSEQKCIRSKKYAAEHGLPILKNVLMPKTKGFCACLQELGGSLNPGSPLTPLWTFTFHFRENKICSLLVATMQIHIILSLRRF